MKDLCGEIRNATFSLGMLARKRVKDPETRLEILKQAGILIFCPSASVSPSPES